MQAALARHAKRARMEYIVKADVANCFASINQHMLVNALRDAGYPPTFLNTLENFLVSLTGDRNSRGIVQGIFPSDLFGNFYLNALDQACADARWPSMRYVDDIYVFVRSLREAGQVLRRLTEVLRQYDLVLNEAKSYVLPKEMLVSEEPDLEAAFRDAVQEVRDQLNDEDFSVDYGLQSDWGDSDEDESPQDVTLRATEVLFDSIEHYPDQEEKIERFCLPLFTVGGSDYAVNHVLESFGKRPSMTQIYCAYPSALKRRSSPA
jgi:hypothetical protein